jgi:hypothetical protein
MEKIQIIILTVILLVLIRSIILIITKNSTNYIEKFENQSAPDKIAFCFLTIDNIHKLDVWEQFFKGNEDKYSIYIHPKNPENVSNKYKKNIIGNLVETKWGDVSLVRATLNLFKAAYQDPQNKMFVLVSDSCIPLNNFDFIYNELIVRKNKSNIISIRNDTPQGYKFRHNALKNKDPNFLPFINFKNDPINHFIQKNPDRSVPFVMDHITYKKGTNILEESQQFQLCVDLLNEGYILHVIEIDEITKKLQQMSESYNNRLKFFKPGTNPQGYKINL